MPKPERAMNILIYMAEVGGLGEVSMNHGGGKADLESLQDTVSSGTFYIYCWAQQNGMEGKKTTVT